MWMGDALAARHVQFQNNSTKGKRTRKTVFVRNNQSGILGSLFQARFKQRTGYLDVTV